MVGNPISVGSKPFDIDITPDGKFAYVTSLDTDKVYVIDTFTNTLVGDPIPVGDGPFGITITPDGNFAYIANYYSRNVYIIDTSTNTVIVNSIPVGVYPRAIAIANPFILGTVTADLSVIKTDSPDPIKLGDNLTYTITVTNNGPDKATGVILKDTLPPSVTFASAESSKGSCSEAGGVVTCELGSLDNSESETVRIKVIPTSEGTITNIVAVSANEDDPDISNNTAIQCTTVLKTMCVETT